MTKGAVTSNANGINASTEGGGNASANKGPRNKSSRRYYRSWKQNIFPSSGIQTTSTPIEAGPEKGMIGMGSSYDVGGGGCSSNSSTNGNGVEVICSYCMNSHPEFQQCCCEMDSGLYSTTVDSLSPGYYGNYSQASGPAFYYPNMPTTQQQQANGGVFVLSGPEYDGSSGSPCYSDYESQQGIFFKFAIFFLF